MRVLDRVPLRGLPDEQGFTFVEVTIALALLVIVSLAVFAALDNTTRAQNRDQAYALEVTSTQTALARLTHDLRQATSFQLITPTAIQFQMTAGGTTYNVKYDCTAADSLGGTYRRCARTSAVAPASPPAYRSTVGSLDILHVADATSSSFCNSNGSAQAAVFFVNNPSTPNTDGSGLACDEAYETIIAQQLLDPTYVQVLVQVPASGSLRTGGMTHQTVLESGAFIPNMDPGA